MIILLIVVYRSNTMIPTASSICGSWMIVSKIARLSHLICVMHLPFCMLLLAYHVSNIAPAPDVAPRSHSTPSPHIAARSHIASNLHLALPSLISCALYRSYCTCSASILCVARILQLNLLTSPILLLSRKIYWDQDYI